MKNYIYSYKNKITGNRYIGKTNNIERRKREHLSNAFNPKSSYYNSMWMKKVREYGIENFNFEVLEECEEDKSDEREIYWISHYNSFLGSGYNSTAGGDSNDRITRILTNEEAKTIRKKLKENKEIQSDISKEFNISQALLSNINIGLKYTSDEYDYPIRKNYKTDEDYKELIDLLINSTLSYKKIAEKLNIGESTIKKINYGILRPDLFDSHPIRKQNHLYIKEFLIYSELSFEKISKLRNVTKRTVNRINNGETHYDKNFSYPLR